MTDSQSLLSLARRLAGVLALCLSQLLSMDGNMAMAPLSLFIDHSCEPCGARGGERLGAPSCLCPSGRPLRHGCPLPPSVLCV
jgi:hypothetical protein